MVMCLFVQQCHDRKHSVIAMQMRLQITEMLFKVSVHRPCNPHKEIVLTFYAGVLLALVMSYLTYQ